MARIGVTAVEVGTAAHPRTGEGWAGGETVPSELKKSEEEGKPAPMEKTGRLK